MILTEAPTRNLTLTLNKAPALTRTETVAHPQHLTGIVPRAQAATDEARIAAATSLASTPGVRAALRAYRAQELLGQLAGVLMVAHKALPPLALDLLWPLLAPLWRRCGSAQPQPEPQPQPQPWPWP